MQTCDIHTAIAFEGDLCPICLLEDEMQSEIEALKNDINNLECDNEFLKERLKIIEKAYNNLEHNIITKK